jgi:hypothetical protein
MWQKSTYSGNGGNCIEAMVTWQKSSRSNGASMCVEVAKIEQGVTATA